MHGMNGPDHGARGARRYVMRALEASLRRLRTDHIDLYQLHEPDPVTPIEETLAALDDLVTAGKVRYVGSSNVAGWQIADAAWVSRTRGWAPFVSAQNHYRRSPRSSRVPRNRSRCGQTRPPRCGDPPMRTPACSTPSAESPPGCCATVSVARRWVAARQES
jgi:hypothetical protein